MQSLFYLGLLWLNIQWNWQPTGLKALFPWVSSAATLSPGLTTLSLPLTVSRAFLLSPSRAALWLWLCTYSWVRAGQNRAPHASTPPGVGEAAEGIEQLEKQQGTSWRAAVRRGSGSLKCPAREDRAEEGAWREQGHLLESGPKRGLLLQARGLCPPWGNSLHNDQQIL